MKKRHPPPGRDDYSALASARRATPVQQKMGVQTARTDPGQHRDQRCFRRAIATQKVMKPCRCQRRRVRLWPCGHARGSPSVDPATCSDGAGRGLAGDNAAKAVTLIEGDRLRRRRVNIPSRVFGSGAFAGMAATDRRYVADVKNTYKLLSLTNFHDVSVDASLKKLLAFSRA